jgi:hypothetical protein
MLRQTGKAGAQSAFVTQISRFPGVPHTDGSWHVWPPPSQQTIPAVQSAVAAQISVVPPGQAVPAWQLLEPPPSAGLLQHT